jgi:hypothetical protein
MTSQPLPDPTAQQVIPAEDLVRVRDIEYPPQLQPSFPEGHTASPHHEHVTYKGGVSFTSASICENCGAFVPFDFRDVHQDFHDRVSEALSAANAPIPEKKAKKKPKK